MIVRLMESNVHPHVLVLGHSFVKRMIFYLRPGKKLKDLYSLNFAEEFNQNDVCRVSMLGIWGRTMEKLLRYDLKAIRDRQPEIIVLEIGSNDLCDASWEPQAIAEAIQSCGQLLLQSLNLKQLIFCGVLPRVEPHVPYAKYNANVPILNDAIKEFCRHTPNLSFWKHKGFVNPVEGVYSIDGIHMNGAGNGKLFKSYRGAILFALKQAAHREQR